MTILLHIMISMFCIYVIIMLGLIFMAHLEGIFHELKNNEFIKKLFTRKPKGPSEWD